MKTGGIFAVTVAACVFLVPARAGFAAGTEQVPARAATAELERVSHELTHVVQQGQSRPATVARSRPASGGGATVAPSTPAQTSPAAAAQSTSPDVQEISRLADAMIVEAGKLQGMFEAPQYVDGRRYVADIGNDARQIKALASRLGPNPTLEQSAAFNRSVSERLRHKDRAIENLQRWLDGLGEQSTGPATTRPATQAVRAESTNGTGAQSAPGRVAVRPADSTRSSESLSLNFGKVEQASVGVTSIFMERNRFYVLGSDRQLYLLPDATYRSAAGGEIQIQAGKMMSKAGPDIVVKGSTIKENAVPEADTKSGQASGRRTYQPIVIRKRIDASTPTATREKTWRPVVIITDSDLQDGRYDGPGGVWIEVRDGQLSSAGGSLEQHRPPPFIDVNGDGSIGFRN